MRRVLFGGSFDPVHQSHLDVGRAAAAHLGAERVSLIPAAASPHKPDGARASSDDRLAMLRIAILGDPLFDILDVEIRRGGKSFTYDTVRELMDGPCRGDSLMLLLGQDALIDLPRWYRAKELAALVPIAVVPRKDVPPPDWNEISAALGPEAMQSLRSRVVPMTQSAISSSDIRKRRAEGRSIRCYVPDPVVDYIEAHGLYQ